MGIPFSRSGALPSGTVVGGRYRLLEALDSGAMGIVYVAESIEHRQRVAVKMLRAEFCHEASVVGRFLDEARAAQRLVHPNVVRTLDHGLGTDARSPFIVLELLLGLPLIVYTQHGGRVPPPIALIIARGVLDGLEVAHGAGIVHRDLKPANVFLAQDQASGLWQVKLLDFGVAKVMDLAGGMGSMTKSGMFLGTPAYMSPEQIISPRDVDARSDLWALGVLLYRMLSGVPPFPGTTEVDRMTAIVHHPPFPIERVDAKLAPFATFMMRALEKDRASRFQSATQMAEALGVVADRMSA